MLKFTPSIPPTVQVEQSNSGVPRKMPLGPTGPQTLTDEKAGEALPRCWTLKLNSLSSTTAIENPQDSDSDTASTTGGREVPVTGDRLFVAVTAYSAHIARKGGSLQTEVEPCERYREEVRSKWDDL
ncbi:hypothetical protein FOZ62_012904, partial [Perkinsus olseni]